ncbi:MAG: hypothetical protein LAT67_11330 [Balneolales bacterium]|nr:hypothetical protein [Balneolales bacterium]
MLPLQRQILLRHRKSLKGSLRVLPFRSRALGISRNVYVYEPHNIRSATALNLLYLFRGHEREWVYIDEDATRQTTSIEDLDRMIAEGEIPPVLAIIPGLTSLDGKTHSLGINMMGRDSDARDGLGSGLFWDYLIQDLIPYIEARYKKKLDGGLRLASGFSVGGYTAALLASAFPAYLDHVGIYDGLLMYDNQIDTRTSELDTVWMSSPYLNAALGNAQSRSVEALSPWNPSELIAHADPISEDGLKDTMFWIRSAAGDGDKGNLDRCTYFTGLIRATGLAAGFNRIPLHPEAGHTWHWNDRFLNLFLKNVFTI